VWTRTEPSGVKVSGATGNGNDILVETFDSATNTANLETRDARTGATVSTTQLFSFTPTAPFATPISGVTKSGPWAVTFWTAAGFVNLDTFVGEGGFQVTNLDNPSLSWSYDFTGGEQVDEYGYPVIEGDRHYLEHIQAPITLGFPAPTSTVEAWNLSGCTNQCAPLFETSPATTAIEPPIGSQNGRAVYAPIDAGFAAYDPATGAQQWAATIPNSLNQVVATTDDAEVVDSSFTSGNQLAVYPATCAAAPCAPTWTATLSGSVTRAVVANGVIYAALDSGSPSTTTLAAYPLNCTDGCQPLWTMPVGEEVTTGPIVSNGQVLYGTASGKVDALTP
jgi:hypothetical protein